MVDRGGAVVCGSGCCCGWRNESDAKLILQRFYILNCKFKLCLNWEDVVLMMVGLRFCVGGLFGVWDEFLYWKF